MELELEFKLARVADEFSSADFLFAKDRSGPLFISTESDSFFFLTAHLKGYRMQNVKIQISEDGSRIIIRGEKEIQENVIVGWKLYKKETEMRRFRKAFKLPNGVILDKVKAKFNEDEPILTISIPKREKGIHGLNIEEVKEEQVPDREGLEYLQIVPDDNPNEDTDEIGLEDDKSPKMAEISSVEELKEAGFNIVNPDETQLAEIHDMEEQEKKENQLDQSERLQKVSDDHAYETDKIEETKTLPDEVAEGANTKSANHESHNAMDGIPRVESGMQRRELEEKEISQSSQGKIEEELDQPTHVIQETDQSQNKCDEIEDKGNDIQEESSTVMKPAEESQEIVPSKIEEEKGRCKLCTPILAGSLLLTLVVCAIHFIRSKSQQGKKKD